MTPCARRSSSSSSRERSSPSSGRRPRSLTRLTEGGRRRAGERRAALHERERRASAELSEALAKVEQRTSRRLAEWTGDLGRAEQGLASQVAAVGQRQEQLLSEATT